MEKKRLITILGPTASGKTGKAVSLCRHIKGEIISGDSRQLYRGMDIGTGKDLEEYEGVDYHLIDICNAGEKYNLFRYLSDFKSALSQIRHKDKWPVLCGGTGMYIEAVLNGLNLPSVPENKELRLELENKSLIELKNILKKYKTLHNDTDVDNKKRAIRAIEIEVFYKENPDLAEQANKNLTKKIDSLIIGIDIPREKRRERILQRLERRLNEGMIDEISTLLKNGLQPEDLIYYGLEYKYVTLFVEGVITFEEMKEKLYIAICQFSKRQMTWFRGMEKRGFHIDWIPFDIPASEFNEKVLSLLNSSRID